jgi:molecular chaperone GrpE
LTETSEDENEAIDRNGMLSDTEGQAAIAEERRRSEALGTNLKYLQADFENYRKRTDKEMKDVQDFATMKLVVSLLSVLDELELAITHAVESGEKGALLDGITMVYKNLSSTLEREGLREIESVGKPFDPVLHEAVVKVPGDGEGEAVVVEEIRKGFMFKNKVIRPSMVKVKLESSDTPKSEVETSE